MRRNPVPITLALTVLLGLSSAARAEVRAITDRAGNYRLTRILTPHANIFHRLEVGERAPGPWRPVGRGAGPQTLNPEGDRQGDLWPTIIERRQRPNYPWVFWSRRNGSDYDLAWSRWTGHGWSPIAWVFPDIPGDDLDPAVVLDATGRPYLAWWANAEGGGQVYFSVFLETGWLVPLRVSEGQVDARRPKIEFRDGSIVIHFATASGDVEYTVSGVGSSSITDDINPLDLADDDDDDVQVSLHGH